MYSAIPVAAFEPDFRNQLKPCDDAKSQLFSYDFLLSEKFIKKSQQTKIHVGFWKLREDLCLQKIIFSALLAFDPCKKQEYLDFDKKCLFLY